jgi:hypothetical protein
MWASRPCESAFTTTCTLIEWYSFLFTNWSSCCEGAIIRTSVPPIRPKIFGKLQMSYNFLLFTSMPCVVGNFMNLWERRTNALHTECTALETVDWSTLKVSAVIIWKEPLAKNLSDINTLISGSIALLRKVELSKSSCSRWVICRIALLTYSIRYRLTWNYNSDNF